MQLPPEESDAALARPPLAVLAMHPVVMEQILRSDHVERLRRCCRMPLDAPLRSLDELGELAPDVEILVTSWGLPALTAQALAPLSSLRLIAHLAGSVKGFVDESAWRRGIHVTNAVDANAVPVAEYVVAATLFANKRVFQLRDCYREYRENRAPWTREAPAAGNYRKRVGVVGASHVGRKVIELLRPYTLSLAVHDPYLGTAEARALGVERVPLDDLLRRSDVVSLNVPLLPDTRHLIGARELSLMPDGATLINTARGAVVDHAALEHELTRGRLYAVLDTTDPEPLPPDSPLYALPNVFLTPHIAGSLGSEVERLGDCIVQEVERFTRGLVLQHRVRFEELPRLA
jgi:phosphoglycerate dehydrogenase-like enzyme